MQARNLRMQKMEQELTKGAHLGAAEKKLQDNFHGAVGQYASLFDQYQEMVKTYGPADYRVNSLYENLQKARATRDAIDAEYGGAIRQGRFGQEMQHKLANGANIQEAEGYTVLGGPAHTYAPTATGDNRVVDQPSTFDFSAPSQGESQQNDNTDFNSNPDFVLPQSGMQNWFLNPGGVQ